MKRILPILISLLLAAALWGCVAAHDSSPVSFNGFQVDTENATISHSTLTYHYTFSGNSQSYSITITYPNGSSYWCSKSGATVTSGWSNDYSENGYADGDTLCQVILASVPQGPDTGKLLGAGILFALGAFLLAFPQLAWQLEFGWRYREAEPSDAALILARVSGGVVIFLGIILLFC